MSGQQNDPKMTVSREETWIIIIFLNPRYLCSQGGLKMEIQNASRYYAQSVRSAAGRQSCSKMALKRCTKTIILSTAQN